MVRYISLVHQRWLWKVCSGISGIPAKAYFHHAGCYLCICLLYVAAKVSFIFIFMFKNISVCIFCLISMLRGCFEPSYSDEQKNYDQIKKVFVFFFALKVSFNTEAAWPHNMAMILHYVYVRILPLLKRGITALKLQLEINFFLNFLRRQLCLLWQIRQKYKHSRCCFERRALHRIKVDFQYWRTRFPYLPKILCLAYILSTAPCIKLWAITILDFIHRTSWKLFLRTDVPWCSTQLRISRIIVYLIIKPGAVIVTHRP